jgi:hypothetical protein
MTGCSSLANVILEFAFENLMTFNILINAFIDEPLLKNYSNILTCANKYAVDNNNFLSETVHGYNLKLADENDEKCKEMTETAKEFTNYPQN